jgi:hypothetical protein
MTLFGREACGCDCRNETRTLDPTYPDTSTRTGRWGCCGNETPPEEGIPGGVPSGYAVLFECEHPWPWQLGDRWWVDANEFQGGGGTAMPSMTYPIHFLGKVCTHGCVYQAREGAGQGACVVPCPPEESLQSSYFRVCRLENQVPGANSEFPAYRYKNPPAPDGESQFDYVRHWLHLGTNTRLQNVFGGGVFGTINEPDPGPDDDRNCGRWLQNINPIGGQGALDFVTWVLDVKENGVGILSWAIPNGSPAVAERFSLLRRGRPIPTGGVTYISDANWTAFGRNTLTLQNPQDWPSLPEKVCVVPVHWPFMAHRCDDHESFCKCAEFSNCDSLPFSVRFCEDETSTALSMASSRDLPWTDPPGVSVVDSPCGYWWGTYASYLCTGFTAMGFQVWCDGSEWHVKPYCYNGTTWTAQAEADVSNYSVACDGIRFTWTAGEIECLCCPPPECCPCADLPSEGTISDGTNSYTIVKNCAVGEGAYAIPAGLGSVDFCGASSTGIGITCNDGVWVLDGAELPCVGPLDWDGDCDAIVLTGVLCGCAITVAI